MQLLRRFSLVILLCGLFASPAFVRAEGSAPQAQAEASPTPIASPSPAPTSAAASPVGGSTFESAFQAGLEAYQKQDYAAAQGAFAQALSLRPDEESTLFNLGITQARLNHPGLALGYLRRTLTLDPGHSAAHQAVKFILKQGQVHELPHQIETWETLHAEVLSTQSVAVFAFLSLMLFFATGWTWFNFLGTRRRALLSETALPSAPVVASALTLLFTTSVLLTAAKIWDQRDGRATIIAEKVPALTAPAKDAPSIFELSEGLEVLVRQTKEDWVQVTYPGAMTGWIPKNAIFVTHAGVPE